MNIIFLLLTSFFFLHSKEFKNVLHSSWWAGYQSISKNQSQASDWFNDVISADNSICSHRGYIQHLYRHEKYADLIEYCKNKKKKWVDQDSTIKKLYALALLHMGNTALSDSIFLEIIREGSSDLEVCFYGAQVYMRAKEFENALLLIDGYLNGENKDAGIFILYFLKGQLCLQLNRISDAKDACQQAVLLRPDFEKGWLLLGVLAEQEGDFPGAISGYKNYLALDASSAIDTGVYNGILSAIARNFFLKQAQEKKHFNGPMVMQKAQTSFKNHQYAQAIEYTNQFLCDDPSNLDMFCLKVEALAELERYDELVACVLDQIEQSPTGKSWYKVLDWCFQYGPVNHALIIDRLKKIQEMNHQTVLPLLCIIDFYCNNDQFAQAEDVGKIFSQLIADSSLKKILLFRLADMYKQQEKHEEMVGELEKILEIQPDNHMVFELLANHFINKKDYPKALDIVSQWRTLHALCPRALAKHGIIFYKQEKYDDAQQLFAQAQLHQSSPLLFLHQAKIAHKKGFHSDVTALCQQAKQNATPYELELINKFLAKQITSPRQ